MAAVATRLSPRVGRSSSRTSSPMDSKRNVLKAEDNSKKSSPLQSKATELDVQPATSETATTEENLEAKPAVATSEPLAPPPRPGQTQNPENTPDYFSGIHNGNHFSYEPNPFEQSFGNPSAETPGKSLLPPVASLTSPALPGANSTNSFNWANSLRSGPLSPAMLAGPAGSSDYFDGISRGFPTPNESSLRTGLTPGGGGSMFPAPSPNSQALFQQLQSGGATPGTLDFHRTAMNAAAARKTNQFTQTSNPQDQVQGNNMEQNKSQPNDSYTQHDATDAANGLFMLAKGGQANNQFSQAMPQQGTQAKVSNGMSMQQGQSNGGGNGSNTSPAMSGEMSDSPTEASRPNTRGKGKKGNTAKQTQASNNRRKAEDTPAKGGNKRSKGNNGSVNLDPSLEPDDSDEEEQHNDNNNKKMTDEEKRKNFLERNRVAALKCRQRKKQWLANLQAKVEIFSSENDALSAQVTQLREEVVNLKTLLLAHKDCPVSQAQGIGGMVMNGIANDFGAHAHHANPYGMAIQNGQGVPMRT